MLPLGQPLSCYNSDNCRKHHSPVILAALNLEGCCVMATLCLIHYHYMKTALHSDKRTNPYETALYS